MSKKTSLIIPTLLGLAAASQTALAETCRPAAGTLGTSVLGDDLLGGRQL